MMEKFIIKVLGFFCTVVVPLALAWAFMSYHKYSLFGVVWGAGMALFLLLASLIGRDNEK